MRVTAMRMRPRLQHFHGPRPWGECPAGRSRSRAGSHVLHCILCSALYEAMLQIARSYARMLCSAVVLLEAMLCCTPLCSTLLHTALCTGAPQRVLRHEGLASGRRVRPAYQAGLLGIVWLTIPNPNPLTEQGCSVEYGKRSVARGDFASTRG